jgi:hypothetical protein
LGKRAAGALFLAMLLASTSAHAWFFFFIPGSVVGKIGDAITGSEGENCVAEKAKVGDVLTSPTGNTAVIKSLSGTSGRCPKPELPIRAKLEFTYSFSSKAGIEIPEGYEQKLLNETQRFAGMLLKAENSASRTGFLVSTRRRAPNADPAAVARSIGDSMTRLLQEGSAAHDEQLQINDMNAWRFEVAGKTKGLFGQSVTYLVTILEGNEELVVVNAWAPTGSFAKERQGLEKIAAGVKGIKTGDAPVATTPPTIPSAEGAAAMLVPVSDTGKPAVPVTSETTPAAPLPAPGPAPKAEAPPAPAPVAADATGAGEQAK